MIKRYLLSAIMLLSGLFLANPARAAFTDINAVITGLSGNGTYAPALSWADFDNDGDLDLALAGTYDGTNYISRVYRNDAGTFINVTGATISAGTKVLSVGDYDNDGDLDLVFACDSSTEDLRLFRNDKLVFSAVTGGYAGAQYNESISFGDYDNDGDLDLASSGSDGALWRNDPGGFVFDRWLSGYGNGSSLILGDYTNDGYLDIVEMGDDDGADFGFWINDGSGNVIWDDTNYYGCNNIKAGSLAMGDFDNDGDLDLASCGTYSTNCLTYVYRNDAGVFYDTTATITQLNQSSLSAGDYDNDGNLDLAISGWNGSAPITYIEKYVALNNWTNISGITALYKGFLTFGDYDNDGDLDLATCGMNSTGTRYTRVFQSNQSLTVANSTPTAPSSGFSVIYDTTTDANIMSIRWGSGSDSGTGATPGKGLYYDIRMATVPITNNLSKWIISPSTGLGVGSGVNQRLGSYPHGYCVTGTTTTGVNLKLPQGQATYYWQIRTIDAGLRASPWSTQQSTCILMSYTDVYPPGKVTGLFAQDSLQVKLLWNAPGDDGYANNVTSGMWRIDYSSTTNTPGGQPGSYSINISTNYIHGLQYSCVLNNLQALVTYYFQIKARDDVELWGEWSSSASYFVGHKFTSEFSWDYNSVSYSNFGDYDNDGDLDIAITDSAGPEIEWNDSGSFTNSMLVYNMGVDAFDAGDYDNDGDLDIVAWANVESYTNVLRNDGLSFAMVSGTAITGVLGKVRWGDYDNDGDLDLALCGSNDGGVTRLSRIYRNDNGNFYNATGTTITGVDGDLAWADYDNDGDLDLGIAGEYTSMTNGMSRVYRNTRGVFANATGTTITGILAQTALSWLDYDNDGDMDLFLTGNDATWGNVNRIYRNQSGASFSVGVEFGGDDVLGVCAAADYDNNGYQDIAFAHLNIEIFENHAGSFQIVDTLPTSGSYSIEWGDYDNDGDLDIASSRLYRSLVADCVSTNTAPVPPSGMTAKYTYAVTNSTIAFRWDPGQYDTGRSSNSLYYQVVVATNPTTWDGVKFTSPSKFSLSWQYGSPLMGNYIRPAAKVWPGDATPKHTIFYSSAAATLTPKTTYYWRVRTIDAGLRTSDWSAEYSICTTSADVTAPDAISNLTALDGGVHAVRLTWTSPGDDKGSGDLAGALFRIKYSTVAIIKTVDFDAPASSYCARTVDISTTTSAASFQTTVLTNLNDGTTYWFAIKTVDNAGNWSVWKSSKDVATINTLAWYTVPSVGGNDPNMPAGLALYTSTTTWPALTAGSWTNYQRVVATFTLTDPDSADTVQYNIQFSTQADFSYNYVNSTAPASATLAQGATYYISPLLPDGTWYWRVRAIDGYGYASAYASMTAVNGIHFGIDATAPQAITTLGAVTGFDPGIIHLSWTAPGDDGSANAISGGAYRVRYATYVTGAGDYWTDASANWTEWSNKYEVTWATGTVPLASQARTLTGLTPGVTYYIRVWARDEIAGSGEWDGNWSALSFGVTTYAQAVLLDVNAQPDIALDLGAVATRTTKILASSFTVINTGNVQVKYRLQLTGVPGAWSVQETPGATAGYDQIKLLALFTTMNPPGSADFTDDIAPNAGGDIVRASTYDVATSSSFAVAAESATVKGYACTVGSVRRLWFRFDAPWATAVITPQNLTVTVTAVQD